MAKTFSTELGIWWTREGKCVITFNRVLWIRFEKALLWSAHS